MKTEKEIVDTLTKANEIYWKTGQNYFSDETYFGLEEQLRKLNPQHELLKKVQSPVVSSLGKIKHATPMLSLEKVYSIEELKKWMQKVARTPDEKFLVMPKYDGIAGRWDYENKILSTRGDGEEGENISHHAKNIGRLDILPDKDGEILIRDDVFKNNVIGKVQRSSGDDYKNSRNAVAGLLNNDREFPKGIVEFYPYDYMCRIAQIGCIEEKIQTLKAELHQIPNDGFVVKIQDPHYAAAMGFTTHHWKHSVALKHANESGWTQLIGVEFQMAKDTIGMVGILSPVEINGVTIRRVSLHNLDIIHGMDLMINDRVLIERAGDVIPYIVEREAAPELREDILLENCPSCSTPVYRDNQFYRCPNENCEDKVVNKIDAALKDLGSKGIATATIRDLVQWGQVRTIADMFDNLSVHHTLFFGKEGYQHRKIEKIITELERVKSEPKKPEQVFAALNLPGFGKSLFKKLFRQRNWLLFPALTRFELSNLDQMSDIRADLLFTGLEENKYLIDELVRIFTMEEPPQQPQGVQSMKICFTGKGNLPRKEYQEWCDANGHEFSSSVTGSTDLLVCADPESNSSKMKSAREKGIEIRSYTDFESDM